MYQETCQLYLKILVYLDNASEEAISEKSQIEERHETIKLVNVETRILQRKYLTDQSMQKF